MAARIFLIVGLAVWALVATLVGLGFLTWAAYAALLTVMAPPWAAVIVAAALFVVSAILVAALAMRPKRRRGGGAAGAAGGGAADPGQAALQGILGVVLRHPKAASVAALGAGVAVGVSPRLRRMLREVLQ